MKIPGLLFIPVFLSLFFTTLSLHAQDPKDILRKAIHKCETIDHGDYLMTETSKSTMLPDTARRRLRIYFKKLPEDKLFGFAFAIGWPNTTTNLNTVVYTGHELVYVYPNTRKGKIMAVDKWAGNIEGTADNYTFFNPFTAKDHKPLPTLAQLETPLYTFSAGGTTTFHHQPCHVVSLHANPDSINTEGMKVLNSEIKFWISDQDSLILQYSSFYDMLIDKDTIDQYQRLALDTFSLNQQKKEPALTLEGIPADVTLEEYIIENAPDLLSKGAIAPTWKFISLTGDSVSLEDLKGNLVLVSFLFKNCFPCMKALPAIQSLNEKYYQKGLRVVGIDPYDLRNDDLVSLLREKGVTFPLMTGGKKVVADYHLSSFPTLYLIDRNGKIISSSVGNSDQLENQLKEVILSHL